MKLLTWLIKMAKKVLNLDTANGVHSWENGITLPSGTVSQTLRHDGTNWTANSKFVIVQNFAGTEIDCKIQYDTNGTTPKILMHNQSSNSYITLYQTDSKFIESYVDTSISQIQLKGTASNLKLLSTNGTDGVFLSNTSAKFTYLSGSGDRPVFVSSDGTMKIGSIATQVNADWNATAGFAVILNKPTVYNHIEFTSNPIVTPSPAYAFSNVGIGLDNVNLINKVKNVKSYIIQNGTTALDNSLIQGEIIEANQITVVCNSALFAGDVIKMYIEYE